MSGAWPSYNAAAPTGTMNGLPASGPDVKANSMPVTRATDDPPVPITPGYPASGVSSITSTFAATGVSTSFTPIAGRGFDISAYGTFAATIVLERSFDAGANWLPLTANGMAIFVWSSPFSEVCQEDKFGVIYRLHCTAYVSGTVNYRFDQ